MNSGILYCVLAVGVLCFVIGVGVLFAVLGLGDLIKDKFSAFSKRIDGLTNAVNSIAVEDQWGSDDDEDPICEEPVYGSGMTDCQTGDDEFERLIRIMEIPEFNSAAVINLKRAAAKKLMTIIDGDADTAIVSNMPKLVDIHDAGEQSAVYSESAAPEKVTCSLSVSEACAAAYTNLGDTAVSPE